MASRREIPAWGMWGMMDLTESRDLVLHMCQMGTYSLCFQCPFSFFSYVYPFIPFVNMQREQFPSYQISSTITPVPSSTTANIVFSPSVPLVCSPCQFYFPVYAVSAASITPFLPFPLSPPPPPLPLPLPLPLSLPLPLLLLITTFPIGIINPARN
jgi:hypothetical protein